jgi:hypothetical protein
MKFEVFMAVKIPVLVSWLVMLCGLVSRYVHLRVISPKYGVIIFLRSVGIYLRVHTALQLGR